MRFKDVLTGSKLMRIVLLVCLISSILVCFLLGVVDSIIHHDLYDFGLQFSLDWANPYWIALRMIYVCLGFSSILSITFLAVDLWNGYGNRQVLHEHRNGLAGEQPLSENSLLASCPSCKRNSTKPLMMLDFSSGKSRLVPYCPYCNAELGEAIQDDDEDNLETVVSSPEEKAITKRRRKKPRYC